MIWPEFSEAIDYMNFFEISVALLLNINYIGTQNMGESNNALIVDSFYFD